MTDTKKTRYRVDRNGFGATLMSEHDGTWIVGSCQAPPLGTAEQMEDYSLFISTVCRVTTLLGCSGPLTPVENAYIERYCK